DLVARGASPLGGARLSLTNLCKIGCPVDWILELGSHVKAIMIRDQCHESNWREIVAALASQQFEGSLVITPDACSDESISQLRGAGLWP
ncbi:MAG: hypothetical protein JNG88_17735, partial [Phycisphaerales bacterium]|nr:hypothetical protein [Phycisphaerales bacterium]